MTDRVSSKPVAIPAGRLTRFMRLGAVTAGVAGNMAIQAAGQVRLGARPQVRDLLLTPANIGRVADELARMRGAAMKVGQLLSMDAGDVLPQELADIFARLRDQAHVMPPKQLKKVLSDGWGNNWLKKVQHFDVHPIAAASIGQVHRAKLKDGRDVAIKVQYPGISTSIDSDVANIAGLVKVSGLLPKEFDFAPYVEEARKQLHDETDYVREGQNMAQFASLLSQDSNFAVPQYYTDWSTTQILVMSYLHGKPIEDAADAPHLERNRIASALIELTLREVFVFGLTQSDPNFANYRYNPDAGMINLLDFGATRRLTPQLTGSYRRLVSAGLDGDAYGLKQAAADLALISGNGPFDAQVLDMLQTVFRAIGQNEAFDFSDGALSHQMSVKGAALAEAGYMPQDVPMDVLFLQRKLGGMFLLCSRLGAVVTVKALLQKHLA